MRTSISNATVGTQAGLPAVGGAPLRARFAALTHIGKRRKRNEDSFLVTEDGRMAVLADGMGGRPFGDLAAELASVTVAEQVRVAPAGGTPRDPELNEDEQSLVSAFHAANQRVFEHGLPLAGVQGGIGTTLAAALFSREGDAICVGHVGDSRCYRIRDGEITQLTRDHSLATELIDRAPWVSVQAMRGMPRNVLTRAIGLKAKVTVDIYTESTRPGDVYLLCSDGLWGRMEPEEVLTIVATSASLDEACARLVDRANEYGGQDNITVVLARLEANVDRSVSGMTLRAAREDSTYEETPDLDWNS